jgi:hydroxymethylpyrimidine/phosphomethylpyrimidine kinase
VAAQIEAVLSDIGADAVKTGMLSSGAIIEVVVAMLKKHGVRRLVVDPVMIAKSGARLLREEAIEALRERLLPMATVVTPNVPEARALTGAEINSLARGMDVLQSVALAKDYVTGAMQNAFPLGQGHGPLSHFYRYEDWKRS